MKSWPLTLAFLVGWSAPRPAGAHAPPLATGIGWVATERGEQAVIRTNRGLILEQPEGGTFRIVCNDAFQASLAEVPPVAVMGEGRLLLGTYAAGLVLSSPDHCNFEPVVGPFADLYPIDVKADADGPGRFFAAMLPYDGSSAELLHSSDQGQTAESLATLPGAPSALELAPSDRSRVYVSSTVAEDNLSFGRLLASQDAGQSFTEAEVELDASELRVFLLAVDPNDPDRLFLRSQSRDGITPERLLRSDDAGASSSTVLSAPGPLSAVVQADGVVWAGGADGLYRSQDGGKSFAAAEGLDVNRVSCLVARKDRLYVCGYSGGEFGVLTSGDAGRSFQWFLRFSWVTARLDCPAESDEGRRCAVPFADWREEQVGEPNPEPAEAGASMGASSSVNERSVQGCEWRRPPPVSGGAAALMFGLALAARFWFRRRAVAATLSGGR